MPKWSVNFEMRLNLQHPQLVVGLAKADALASVIRGIPIPPSAQHRIDALNIMRAVRGTTGIEGAELTEEEAHQIMNAPPGRSVLQPNRSREESEARNAHQVMRWVVQVLSEKPNQQLTEDLICEIHRRTTEGIDYEHNVPGRYRNHPVAAGNSVPPTESEEIRVLMPQFAAWFNGNAHQWHPAVQASIAHFYVVSIHPFADGNGRTARAVESFLLYKGGLNARGFYSLSNYYYRNRDKYISMLDFTRFESGSDLTGFVLFAVLGLVEELEAVHKEILEEVLIIAFRDYAREELEIHGRLGTKAGERLLRFLLSLSRKPVSLSELRRGIHPLSHLYRSVTSKTLTRDLNFLVQHELVEIHQGVLTPNLGLMTRFTPPLDLLPSNQPHVNRSTNR